MRVGILTSGGDCAGLNAVMYSFVKAITEIEPKIEICGIKDGYGGLINKEFRIIKHDEFFNILKLGGTILGTSRQPYKKLIQVDDNNKAAQMKENYRKMDLDFLVVLGGQGTHKTAAFLASEGLNVIALPKTIDNDIWGTDFTFGFHSAVNVATECIDRVQTTAASHGRAMLVEIMGNKVGWLTLYAGIGGGADVILIPEIPYDMDEVIKAVEAVEKKKGFCIIAAAEGAMNREEVHLSKKERYQKRAEQGDVTASNRIAKAITERLDIVTRVVVPGHIQRGGTPTPYDRVICTQMGTYAAKLAGERRFGVTVALDGGKITFNNLADVAGKTKFVPPKHELVRAAKDIGISFGE
ncbi:MAG: ATP-dependent 6-phosphofructokinase [Fibromonadaceae bacterium]|jgi:6-phosphofructokinase 1|nr:ATP-dependent 6-phosphofructokinase [Fibromonadaceae bacterium]